jgi:putative glycosyltransferase (TIGR04372 family)
MDHLVLRAGRRGVLIADVVSSADGHGIGYGIMLKRLDRALRYAQATGLSLFLVRESPINHVVFNLESDDVRIVPRRGVHRLWLATVWYLSAPFRLGVPRLWLRRTLARLILGRLYARAESSRWMPSPIRRVVLRQWPWYAGLKAARAEYARRSDAAWKATTRTEKESRNRNTPELTLPLRLRLPAAMEAEALASAARAGIDPSARLVTVHVRESGYRAAGGLRQREWDTLRNARIETYDKAFRALVSRGYTVVRLGDSTMTPVTLPGVVDLALSPARTEALEAWCVLRSHFLIGCDSGPSWLAFLFGVPVLTVNALHLRDVQRPSDRMICKLVRERATGHQLSLTDMLSAAFLREGLRTDLYEHLDNTPSDIAEAAVDMADVVEGLPKLFHHQREFNRMLTAAGRELSNDWTGLQGIALLRRPKGAMSRRFVRRYLVNGDGMPPATSQAK